MKLPDGTTLMHFEVPYDPVKAREYYLRTRKLKGRKAGKMDVPSSSKSGKEFVKNNPNLKKQKVNSAERVAVLTKKLSQLKALLKKQMAEAKEAEKEAKKPDTTAEQNKKSRENEKYRDKNKQKIKNKAKQAAAKKPDSKTSETKKAGGEKSVKELKQTIERVEKNLSAAIAKQRALG